MAIELVDANVVRLITLASVWLALKIMSDAFVLALSTYIAIRQRDERAAAMKTLENLRRALQNTGNEKPRYDS